MSILSAPNSLRAVLVSGLLTMTAFVAVLFAGPVGAHHGKGGHAVGGTEPDQRATVETTGGLVTPAPQEVVVVRDNNKTLSLEDLQRDERVPTFKVAINMANTQDYANTYPEDCTGVLSLRDKLVNAFQGDRFIALRVDKKALGSTSDGKNGHRIVVTWKPENQIFGLILRGATVTASTSGQTREFVFSGGSVAVRDRSDPEIPNNEAPSLICPNKDTVTVKVALQ